MAAELELNIKIWSKPQKIVKKSVLEKMEAKALLQQGKSSTFDIKQLPNLKEAINLTLINVKDQQSIIKFLVDALYRNGSNNRSRKNGSPDSLIATVMKNQMANKPATIGVWLKLME